MAAYAATVTIDDKRGVRSSGRAGLGMLRGSIDLTNYNTTRAEITALTKYFRSGDTPTIVLGGISDNGYLVAWDRTGKSVKAWYATDAHTHVIPVTAGTAGNAVTNNAGVLESTGGVDLAASAATKAAGTEVANDVDVGAVPFIAFGRM